MKLGPGWLSGFFPCLSPLWIGFESNPPQYALHTDWVFSLYLIVWVSLFGVFLPHLKFEFRQRVLYKSWCDKPWGAVILLLCHFHIYKTKMSQIDLPVHYCFASYITQIKVYSYCLMINRKC